MYSLNPQNTGKLTVMGLGKVLVAPGPDDSVTVLHSNEQGDNRHSVVIKNGGYITRLNEEECFARGTHLAMAKAAGIDLSQIRCDTFRR